MRDKGFGSIGVGLSSIILIGVVLCFTVFAALALVSANNDAVLNDRSVAAVKAYYAADAAAQSMISDINELAASGSDKLPDGVTREGERLCFSVPIDNTRMLSVELEYDGNAYAAVVYSTKATGEWTPAGLTLK